MNAFANLLAHCPNLKALVLENSHGDVEHEHEGLDDSVLESLAQNCPLVEAIELRDTRRCPDVGLMLLSKNCKNVIELRFGQCDGFTVASFEHIAKIKSLQDLNFYNCSETTDAGLAALMRGCPNLRELHICDEASSISAAVFRGLKEAPFVNCLIDVSISGDFDDAEDLDDEPFEVTIGESLAYCHNLVTVRVAHEYFGDEGLALMCAGCPSLKELNIYMTENLTMEGLMHAVSICPRLCVCEVTEVYDSQFSESDVEMFQTKFPSIQFLYG